LLQLQAALLIGEMYSLTRAEDLGKEISRRTWHTAAPSATDAIMNVKRLKVKKLDLCV
jgi:hypothetical protein